MNSRANSRGFTLIEMVVVTGLLGLIAVTLGTVTVWGYRLWNITQDQVKAQEQARAAIAAMADEIREMQISDNGSYAIVSAQPTMIIFYANVDSDAKRERVRYQLTSGSLVRGIVKSDASSPPQYPLAQETVSTVAQNITSTSIFEYYDDTYTGSTPPLAAPIDLNLVRLVKVKLLIDYDPGRTPTPIDIQTNVTLRNLKDNL